MWGGSLRGCRYSIPPLNFTYYFSMHWCFLTELVFAMIIVKWWFSNSFVSNSFLLVIISILANRSLFCLTGYLLFVSLIHLLLTYADWASMHSSKLASKLILFCFVLVFILFYLYLFLSLLLVENTVYKPGSVILCMVVTIRVLLFVGHTSK